MLKLKTNRSLLRCILLSFVTFGIYSLVFYSALGEDLNIVASKRDGKKTMHYCLLTFIIAPITLYIGAVVWFHKISNRIGDEARARGINTNFSAGSFWLWNTLGVLIVVGPLIYVHQLCKTMNAICEDYNAKGN